VKQTRSTRCGVLSVLKTSRHSLFGEGESEQESEHRSIQSFAQMTLVVTAMDVIIGSVVALAIPVASSRLLRV